MKKSQRDNLLRKLKMLRDHLDDETMMVALRTSLLNSTTFNVGHERYQPLNKNIGGVLTTAFIQGIERDLSHCK